MGRFLNADSYASTGQGILGNNMFAYCNNNPIISSDYSGHLPQEGLEFGPHAMGYDSTVVPTWGPCPWLDTNARRGTTSFGISYTNVFGGGGTTSFGITFDSVGNIGFIFTQSFVGGFPSSGCSAFLTTTNAPNIYAQRGWAGIVGGSVSTLKCSVGGEYSVFKDSKTGEAYHGGTVFVGAPSLVPIEFHGGASYSVVYGVNVFDVLIEMADIVSER